MMLTCEVPLKDMSPMSKLDAIAYACRHEEIWKVKRTKTEQREKMMKKTDLRNKCGSCQFFKPFGEFETYGKCLAGCTCKPRSNQACKRYERKESK